MLAARRIIGETKEVIMISYQGKDPFAFFSYAHADSKTVIPIIKSLKGKMCRIWYDEGLTPGESWNDMIAEEIVECRQFVVFITPSSVNSRYVMSEINYAISKNKEILPILLEETELPAGFDLMLSTYHRLDVSGLDPNSKEDFATLSEKIREQLDRSVFATNHDPFLEDMGYSFYLRSQDVARVDSNKIETCQIICRDSDGNETELLGLHRLGAYDVAFSISAVERITDYFYQGKINGSYQINLLGHYLLEYPLYGPDVDVILICILRIPRHGAPEIRLVDYQYIDAVSSRNMPEYEDLDIIGERGPSQQIKEYFDKKLKG